MENIKSHSFRIRSGGTLNPCPLHLQEMNRHIGRQFSFFLCNVSTFYDINKRIPQYTRIQDRIKISRMFEQIKV